MAPGVFYPRGGFGRVSGALARLAREAGARLEWNASVESIELDGGGRAIGVRLRNGTLLPSAAVLVNADLPLAEARLLPKHRRRSFDSLQFSCSVISFHWCPALLEAVAPARGNGVD